MNILYLPGQGIYNEAEWKSVTDALEESGHNVIKHRWRKWDDVSYESWVGSYELGVIEKEMSDKFGIVPKTLTPDLSQEREKYSIVAKSIGTLLSLNLIEDYEEQIDKVVFMGLPIQNWEEDSKNERLEKYKQVLGKTKLEITIIQNSNDPLGSFEFINEQFGEFKNIELIETEAFDHGYDYPELINDIINL
ncbi:MAG: hypothetical protein Q9M91_03945 [Candidatus Dojkabacteria bacterium]|nr:hypothetical protein [Candidatus Dojkabacteria bacterium]MDQ7020965.1 hypothetical protein [Candidatus Dojkabacteria bacterium]